MVNISESPVETEDSRFATERDAEDYSFMRVTQSMSLSSLW